MFGDVCFRKWKNYGIQGSTINPGEYCISPFEIVIEIRKLQSIVEWMIKPIPSMYGTIA